MVAANKQRAGFPAESLKTMNGSWVAFDALTQVPVMIIFDNLSTVAVQIATDSAGSNIWKTFAAGSALILDLRANHGIASNFAVDKGTVFYGNGASGQFSITYVYAREL